MKVRLHRHCLYPSLAVLLILTSLIACGAAQSGGSGGSGPPPSGDESGDDQAPSVGGDISLARESGHAIPGFYLGSIAVADYDGDGFQDLAIGGSWDAAVDASNEYTCITRIRLYRNVSDANGEIRFDLQEELSQLMGCGGVIVKTGDFDGDGQPDLAYQFRSGVTSGALLNRGDWQFTQTTMPDNLAPVNTGLGMEAVDVDLDGRDELVFISAETPQYPSVAGGLWYRFDTGSGDWEAQQRDFDHLISYGGTVAAGDLDGDGYPEIAIGGNASIPLGNHDCSDILMYGGVFRNLGAASAGFDPDIMYVLRADQDDTYPCYGSDNAGYLITDVDGDGSNDLIIAGSHDAFGIPIFDEGGNLLRNGQHYDLAVLFNDGSGTRYQAWENPGPQLPGGDTNGGAGNVEQPNIAAGDLNGDGLPEIFVQGHHRDYENDDPGRYIFETKLMRNDGDRTLSEVDLGLLEIAEGGQAMADFNNDGRLDLIFGGATRPWHSNGSNGIDQNDASTLVTEVYRNTGQ